uniref:Uncharacterized protein n=1 Tax=Rhizophora mucronata TaxID=61149 RepID=A0A2P2PWG3_RHIMU
MLVSSTYFMKLEEDTPKRQTHMSQD